MFISVLPCSLIKNNNNPAPQFVAYASFCTSILLKMLL